MTEIDCISKTSDHDSSVQMMMVYMNFLKLKNCKVSNAFLRTKRKYGILIQLVILQEGWHHSVFATKTETIAKNC